MLIHRARRLLAEIAEPLGGTPAGDPRRYRDSSERFAVVAAADDAAPVLDAFEIAAGDRLRAGAFRTA